MLVSTVYHHESPIGMWMLPPSWTFLLPHPIPLGCHRVPDLSSLHQNSKFPLVISFTSGNVYIFMLFSQLSHSPLPPTVSTCLFSTSASPLRLLFSCQVVSNSLWPHGLQHTRLPYPSPSPGICPSSCPVHRWCHPTISTSVTLFFCVRSFPASGSFPMNWLFASGGQSIGASALVVPLSIQDWFPLRLTGMISLLSKGLSWVFSSTTVQNYQFFSTLPSVWSSSHSHMWLLGRP